MNFNRGFKYNFSATDGGAIYNSSTVKVLVNLFETINMIDSYAELIVKRLLSDNIPISEFMYMYVLHTKSDSFEIGEQNFQYYAFFDFLETQKISDIFSDLVISIYLTDGRKIIDEISELNALVEENENFDFSSLPNVKALIPITDKYNLEELEKIFAYISQFDNLRGTDKEPRTAVTDFLIGTSDDKDSAYDWIMPFDLKIDWKSSSIQVMPQTESSYIDMPGVDGSIVEDTIYKNRVFSIVAFSDLGLSISEKEQLKREITQILDATKNETKKLTFMHSDTSFDVKYSGSADIVSGPSYIKATIPFESGPYGYHLFDQEVYGTGLIVNDGDQDVGCVHKISSGAVNPSFQLGTITYSWAGIVPDHTTLYIDHNNYTCYLESVEGTRENALDKLSGEFQVIPKGTSMAITAFGNTGDYLVTTLKEKILW